MRQKEDWRHHLFRAPSRRKWGLWWHRGSSVLTVLYSGSTLPRGPRTLLSGFQLTGGVEGLGLLVILGTVPLAARSVANARVSEL